MRARVPVVATMLTAAALALAGCGTSASPPPTTASGGASSSTSSTMMTKSGTADVAHAGSLAKLFTQTLVPDFHQATGYTLTGPPPAGSTALASEILAKEISPTGFLSIGAKAIKKLWPERSKFALSLAADPLVVAYSSSSHYASQLNAIRSGAKPIKDLFSLMEQPGFRLGRTDPNQDPQGAFFILMIMLATKEYGLASNYPTTLLGVTPTNSIGKTSQVFSETALPTTIASGSVDAGSEYLPEAKQYGLRYITLPPTLSFADPAEASLYGTVSLTLQDGTVDTGEVIYLETTLVLPASGQPAVSADDQAATNAFLAYMLSSSGRGTLASVGYTLEPPVLKLAPGKTSASQVLPPSALSEYNKLGGSISTS